MLFVCCAALGTASNNDATAAAEANARIFTAPPLDYVQP
jgi:hypothetical protein